MNTRVIDPIDMQMVKEYLAQNLRLNIKTKSEYVGDLAGGESLYKDCHTLRLMLGEDVISEVYL